MIQTQNIDVTKKELYLTQVTEYEKRYKDKKSELEWADDEWEESVIKDEMDKLKNRIRLFNQRLSTIKEMQSRAS